MVLPGGLVGFSFWGSPKRLGLLPYFATLLELSPADHVDATVNQGDTGRPGVAERTLAAYTVVTILEQRPRRQE